MTSTGGLRELTSGSALEVAPALLGAVLSHTTAEGTVSVRLTEVEAYLGVGEDPGSHAHRGQTPRTSPMFGPPGHLYAYFTYGMHVCINVVCSPVGTASAVLLRAGEVVVGQELASLRRGERVSARDLARGPARLTVALGVALAQSGDDLAADPFELVLPERRLPMVAGPRTGVGGPGGGAAYPWRFSVPGEPTVSPYKRSPRAVE